MVNEIKTYQLFKGIQSHTMELILNDNKIKNNGMFNSQIRALVSGGKENGISASRNINSSMKYGGYILVFDMLKLSSKYKIVPLCENPDYYLEYDIDNDEDGEPINCYKKIRDRKGTEHFWRVKTDKNHCDFDICEELILADEIDITKYVKKIYIRSGYEKSVNKRVEEFGKKYDIEVMYLTDENKKKLRIFNNF